MNQDEYDHIYDMVMHQKFVPLLVEKFKKKLEELDKQAETIIKPLGETIVKSHIKYFSFDSDEEDNENDQEGNDDENYQEDEDDENDQEDNDDENDQEDKEDEILYSGSKVFNEQKPIKTFREIQIEDYEKKLYQTTLHELNCLIIKNGLRDKTDVQLDEIRREGLGTSLDYL